MGLKAPFNAAAINTSKDINYLATAQFIAEGAPVITTSGERLMRFEIAGEDGKPQPHLMNRAELSSQEEKLKAAGDSSHHFFGHAIKALDQAKGNLPIVGNQNEGVYLLTNYLIHTRISDAQLTASTTANQTAPKANIEATP